MGPLSKISQSPSRSRPQVLDAWLVTRTNQVMNKKDLQEKNY